MNRAVTAAAGAVRRFLGYDPVYRERTEFYPQRRFSTDSSRGVWEVNDQHAYVRQVSESATNELQLSHVPIRSVAHLYVDYDGKSGTTAGAFAASTEKDEGTDFWPNYDLVDSRGYKVCQDGILRSLGAWPTSPGTVKIVYTAGYTEGELKGTDTVLDASPIWYAVLEESCRRARRTLAMQSGSLGLPIGIKTSESLGAYSYSLDAGTASRMYGAELLAETKERLSAFVHWGNVL